MTHLSRRGFLATLALALPALSAFGPSSHIDVAELDLGPGTVRRPNAWKRLLYDVEQLTAVTTRHGSVHVAPEDPALFEHPFAVLLVEEGFAEVSDAGVEALSQFLAYGGFLYIDDVSGGRSSSADEAIRRLLRRIFPTRTLAQVAADHSVLRSFFLLKGAPGRVATAPHLEAITVGNLSPVVYNRNDLSGALDRGEDGRPVNPCVPGGERQRREGMKLGVNLLMYSLTANYKNDQAHVRELMLEGRLE